MKRLEVSGTVRPLYGSLDVKRLNNESRDTASALGRSSPCISHQWNCPQSLDAQRPVRSTQCEYFYKHFFQLVAVVSDKNVGKKQNIKLLFRLNRSAAETLNLLRVVKKEPELRVLSELSLNNCRDWFESWKDSFPAIVSIRWILL